ncbi:prenyltransferase/squalene oxidase repeat-containing protein [Verrucomicrobiota bacterium]
MKTNSEHYHDVMSLFDELSFTEKWRKVFKGLKQPKNSGEYKYAQLQLIRLMAPISAVIIPVLTIFLIICIASDSEIGPKYPAVIFVEPEPVKKLDEPEEIPEEKLDFKLPDPMAIELESEVNMENDISHELDTPFSPVPSLENSVLNYKSPIKLKTICTLREKGHRGNLLRRFNAPEGVECAVMKALRWLKKHQEPDGSWLGTSGGSKNVKHANASSAFTGLALLTFLAHGELPGSGEFGDTVEKAVKWLVNKYQTDGFPVRYEHAIATYALCEYTTMTSIPLVKATAEKCVDRIIDGQQSDGGWSYGLKANETKNDLSVMGWCAQALKAAKIAGLKNEGLDEALIKAVEGFKLNHDNNKGGFGYNGPKSGGLTGAGVLCMQLLGAADGPETHKGLTYLDDWKYPWDQPPAGRRTVYYYYYVTQAKFHAGGEIWKAWNHMFANTLIDKQVTLEGAGADGNDIGYWEPPVEEERKVGRVYNTCLCALQLEVYYRYLPTFGHQEAIYLAESEDEPGKIPRKDLIIKFENL